jgi:hypothetical protein
MRNWFICKIKYTKEVEGKLKKVSEPYLVDALSFTEAEARIHQELEQIVRGEFSVDNIAKGNFADIFHYEDIETWFKAKVTYVTYDEESGKEKKTSHQMLVTAHDVREAYDRLKESLKDLMVDFEIPMIAASPIIDIFPYFSNDQIPESAAPVAEFDAGRDSFDEAEEEKALAADEVVGDEEETEVVAEVGEEVEEEAEGAPKKGKGKKK